MKIEGGRMPDTGDYIVFDRTGTGIVRCWLCGGQLNWQSDYNPEDMGYGPGTLGIVAILGCLDCGAMVEYTLIEEEE